MQIMWFKRDLRIEDNSALSEAAKRGPVLPLYILEKDLWKEEDMSARHYQFLAECLNELDISLAELGQPLILKIGNAVEVLNDLIGRHRVEAIWSHQETWNLWTYKRDKAVRNALCEKSIPWFEPSQNGVIRGIKERGGWSKKWIRKMSEPLADKPFRLLGVREGSENLPNFQDLGLEDDRCLKRQSGGRKEGLIVLSSFLQGRGQLYSRRMSSPVTAYGHCSRISPYLAFGVLSLREVLKRLEGRERELLRESPNEVKNWSHSLKAFSRRLRWHCHFIQKLEDEPLLEKRNMHAHYNGLRNLEFTEKEKVLFEAWKQGKTGFPMVDACMRALTSTGWLNFRMRAMLMSFSSYHLWLHWREPALHLARLFLDYEPGIHWSQCQMQSGTTGINTIRIYNPVKQCLEQDPKGDFIRKWLPELSACSNAELHRPLLASEKYIDYPEPIVNEKMARLKAADAIYSLKKGKNHSEIASQIVRKHASRKPSAKFLKSRKKGVKRRVQRSQLELSFPSESPDEPFQK